MAQTVTNMINLTVQSIDSIITTMRYTCLYLEKNWLQRNKTPSMTANKNAIRLKLSACSTGIYRHHSPLPCDVSHFITDTARAAVAYSTAQFNTRRYYTVLSNAGNPQDERTLLTQTRTRAFNYTNWSLILNSIYLMQKSSHSGH